MLSREKHIEPEVVVSAIEDAMVVAARKFYKSEEDLRAKFNPESGQVDVYSVYTVVEEVTDPKKEITLAEAKKKNPEAEVGTEIGVAKQMEVQEIYDGTVQIRFAGREAGERTKVAVMSRDKDVDPVGACVGMKGMRVQSIIRELRGEKIDIIPYSEETVAFAQKALSPAKVTRVQITDPENKKLEAIVKDSQLPLASAKNGQHYRLPAELIGWDIDIKSEEEKRQEIEEQ